MQNKWSYDEAKGFTERYSPQWGEVLALRTYSSRLLGSEENLVLHGGGNTSVKGSYRNVFDENVPAIFVKASGYDMASIEPEGHLALYLTYLLRLRKLKDLTDEQMLNELRTHLFNHKSGTPSIEAFVHAFLSPRYIDHTHADAILALTNQPNGKEVVRAALGDDVIILDYVKPGFKLAKAAADAFDSNAQAKAMVIMHHGLITWGDMPRESYDKTIDLVTKAEEYIADQSSAPLRVANPTDIDTARENFSKVGPILRGLLAEESGDPDRPHNHVILLPLIDRETLDFVDSDRGEEFALTPTLTSDHLIRTKAYPMWIDDTNYDDTGKLKEHIAKTIAAYEKEYDAYIKRNISAMPDGIKPFDPKPRVIMMPKLGVICAGREFEAAAIARDITEHTLKVKSQIAAMGSYQGLPEEELFDMEYLPMQHAKLGGKEEKPLVGKVAIVTGAAGAIGAGICRGLLKNGCHVAVTDLTGERLDSLVDTLKQDFGEMVTGVHLDVTDPESVRAGLRAVIQTWGGLDITIICAGVAHVSPLAEMDLDAFRKLERINTEGTLLVLKEIAPLYEIQGTGGDVIIISTKNVFAPGAGFGAYSATKAASHQLGRIASLEFAKMDVRVNMISPDAVFGEGDRKSGLWQEVGPDRMKARGLDEKGLEEYYRDRNLLKARVTAEHCANAVLFFATRQTPTTGATIPVDGGLPDATPR